jgi:putative transposase of IS4/5 family DUF4096
MLIVKQMPGGRVKPRSNVLICPTFLLEEPSMATRRHNLPIHQDACKRYASDLDDEEFALIAPHVAQKDGSGKKRTVDIREVLNALFYRVKTGCQWRMLPSDFPVWHHV